MRLPDLYGQLSFAQWPARRQSLGDISWKSMAGGKTDPLKGRRVGGPGGTGR